MLFTLSTILVLVITFVLIIYSCVLLTSSLFALRFKGDQIPALSSDKSITVLIPCFNEERILIDTINSLLEQKYAGSIHVVLLFNDKNDTSIPYIEQAFNFTHKKFSAGNRNVEYLFTGQQHKKDKLNSKLKNIDTDYVAFLDADHVATQGWLQRSVNFLDKNNSFDAVQSRREAKNRSGFFQLWDSAQNHLGNELLNVSLTSLNQTVFFTGTTAVFRSSVFGAHTFSKSITEDTFLSYDVLLGGSRIGYLFERGSREEVSPQLSDYIARRRRWSTGHTQTFISHVAAIARSSISRFSKTILALHGFFYLLPVISLVLLIVLQGFHFLQFTGVMQSHILLLTVFLSLVLNISKIKNAGYYLYDSLVSLLFVFPFVSLLYLFYLKISDNEIYNFVISFPYIEDALGIILGIIVLVPLLVLLIAEYKLSLLSKKQVSIILLSYPFIILVDMYAIVLGFFDYLFGIFSWKKIQRNNAYVVPYKKIITSLLVFATVFFGYQYNMYSTQSCGDKKNPLLSVLAKTRGRYVEIDYTVNKFLSQNEDSLTFEVLGKVTSDQALQEVIMIAVGDEVHKVNLHLDGSFNYQHHTPFGFDLIRLELSVPGTSCFVVLTENNTLKEIKGNKIYINNEPFLVKGVVPSFAQARSNVSIKDGLDQISSLGSNLIRTYHEPNSLMIEESRKQGLLFFPQPSKSNWNSTDLSLRGSRGLLKRYRNLEEKHHSNPFLFAVNLGNEIELNKPKRVSTIRDILLLVSSDDSPTFSSYASFHPTLNYPSDILGVNMLDTGSTYWEKALPITLGFEKPYIATELGGFEAFFEKTDPVLRSIRLKKYWKRLLDQGASGGIIFQSHDNWAQPVPVGYNNPFIAEQADDVRGLWDENNQQKWIVDMVQALFADIDTLCSVDNTQEKVTISFSNIRDYSLKNIVMTIDGEPVGETFDLSVGESYQNVYPSYHFKGGHEMILLYESHSGVSLKQEVNYPILGPEPRPFFPKKDQVIIVSDTDELIEIISLTDRVEIEQDDLWVSSHPISSNSDGRYINNVGPYKDLQKVILLRNGKEINDVPAGDETGYYEMQFRSSEYLSQQKLVLEGVGTPEVLLLVNGKQIFASVHPYRENIIDLSEYIDNKTTFDLSLVFVRDNHVYLQADQNPEGKNVYIDMELPRLFEPQTIKFTKNMEA